MSSPKRQTRDRSATTRVEASAVLDASPNAILAVDELGSIAYANPMAEATFGYPLPDLLGQPIETLLPERVRFLHTSHRTGFMHRPTVRPMGIGRDLAGRRRDGTEFPVEISLSPVRTDEGTRVFATVVDITARKSAETALLESEHRFRTVLEAAPNAIVAIDRTGRIIFANPHVADTFGYTNSELIGEMIELLLPERVHERHVGHRSRFVHDPNARPMGIGLDLAGRRKDGTEFPVEISLSPVGVGPDLQVFATVVDITARKATEAQLLQAQKLESIGRLAGGIAHDFNNILFAISVSTELLDGDIQSLVPPGPDQQLAIRNVQAIGKASRRGAELTGQLLAFSRQQVVSPKVIDINAAVVGIQPMLERLIGEKVRLALRMARTEMRIKVDPGQFDQILVNLVVNARDAMPDGGLISIETSDVRHDEPEMIGERRVAPGRYVTLSVRDTGMGMDRDTQARVFEPFFTTKERGSGTGLGLATIYGIVDQAGGHIWLASEPGYGSTFTIYFPLVDAAPTPEAEPGRANAPIRTGAALVVEDDESVREMTSRLVERAGFDVTALASASDAIELMRTMAEPPLVVVTDVVMPGMSGIELAELVFDEFPTTGVVLLSGYIAETLGLERVVARGARFVTKPVSSADLLSAIRQSSPLPNQRPT